MKGRFYRIWATKQWNHHLYGGQSIWKFVQSFQILHKSALKKRASFQESKVKRQHKAFQYTELFSYQGHSARSPVAHIDEVIHSAQAMLPNKSDQLRLECHHGHSAKSPVAHIDEVIHSAQATLPNESDQLRLERHQGHSARSPVARIDEVIHSAQATLPNE